MRADIPDARELRRMECEWCDRPLKEGGAFHVHTYDDAGGVIDSETLCTTCYRYGSPRGSRRRRVELAWKIEPQMSLLERIGWWLILRANE